MDCMQTMAGLINASKAARIFMSLSRLCRLKGLHFYSNDEKCSNNEFAKKSQRFENKGPLRSLLDYTFSLTKKRSTSKTHTTQKATRFKSSATARPFVQPIDAQAVPQQAYRGSSNQAYKQTPKQSVKRNPFKYINDCFKPVMDATAQGHYSPSQESFTKRDLPTQPVIDQCTRYRSKSNLQEVSEGIKSYLMPLTPEIKRLIAVSGIKDDPDTCAENYVMALLDFDKPQESDKYRDELIMQHYMENLQKHQLKESFIEPEVSKKLNTQIPEQPRERRKAGMCFADFRNNEEDVPRSNNWQSRYHNQLCGIFALYQKANPFRNSDTTYTMPEIAQRTREALDQRRNIIRRLNDAVADNHQMPKY